MQDTIAVISDILQIISFIVLLPSLVRIVSEIVLKMKKIRDRTDFLRDLIDPKDRFVTQPVFAIAYREIIKRLIGLELLFLVALLLVLLQFLLRDDAMSEQNFIITIIVLALLFFYTILLIGYIIINFLLKGTVNLDELILQKYQEKTSQENENRKI